MERLTREADFGLEDWEETLFFVPSDPNGAYNILDIAKYSDEPEFAEILKNISLRLAAYENTELEPDRVMEFAKAEREGRYIMLKDAEQAGVDRLRELAQADRDGRCVVLPCKIFDKVWNIAGHYQFEVTEIDLLPYGNILFRCGNKGTDDYAAFYGDDLGDTFSLEEPPERDNRADAEEALRREQE